MRLGLDYGNTIVGPESGEHLTEDKTGPANFAKPGAIMAISKLIAVFGEENTFIISKARPRTQEKILAWLKDNEFYKKTGFLPANIRFCLERREKAAICKELNIDIMIDDRPEVMAFLTTVRFRLLFDPVKEEMIIWHDKILGSPRPLLVRDWHQIDTLIDWFQAISHEMTRSLAT